MNSATEVRWIVSESSARKRSGSARSKGTTFVVVYI